jgi:hypothetical protein
MIDARKLVKTLKFIVDLATDGKYSELIERFPSVMNLSVEEVKGEIEEYPATLIYPPEKEFEEYVLENDYENIFFVEIKEDFPEEWSVRVPLWTEEEGASGLHLDLILTESNKDIYDVQFRDVLVP